MGFYEDFMQNVYSPIVFKVTMGVYCKVSGLDDVVSFEREIYHTESIEIDWGSLPRYSSEIPYRLLKSVQHKAEEFAEKFRSEKKSEWCDSSWILSESEWYDAPLWSSTEEVFEVYKYWYDAFSAVFF